MKKEKIFTVECKTWKNGKVTDDTTICAADSYESAKKIIAERVVYVITNHPSAKATVDVEEYKEYKDFTVTIRFGEKLSEAEMFYVSSLSLYKKTKQEEVEG